MVEDDINIKIRRIYAALDAVEETNFDLFKPTVIRDSQTIEIMQSFEGDLTKEELSNLAHSLIHNIANLYEHLRKLALLKKLDVSKVDEVFRSSNEIKIIQDLSNNDKHGYPPRNGGYSGISPKVDKFTRGMQLTALSQERASLTLTLDASGKPKVTGTGNVAVVISGEISDGKGNCIGNLHLVAKKALEAWEVLLSDFGIKS
jgi:hypothetical protein